MKYILILQLAIFFTYPSSSFANDPTFTFKSKKVEKLYSKLNQSAVHMYNYTQELEYTDVNKNGLLGVGSCANSTIGSGYFDLKNNILSYLDLSGFDDGSVNFFIFNTWKNFRKKEVKEVFLINWPLYLFMELEENYYGKLNLYSGIFLDKLKANQYKKCINKGLNIKLRHSVIRLVFLKKTPVAYSTKEQVIIQEEQERLVKIIQEELDKLVPSDSDSVYGFHSNYLSNLTSSPH